jgi:23S rRNA pseudouridine1911/1915/1917 synthase
MTTLEPTVAAVVREQTGLPWSRARLLCAEGRVTVNGERCLDAARACLPGATVVVDREARRFARVSFRRAPSCSPIARSSWSTSLPGMLSVADEPGNNGHARSAHANRAARHGPPGSDGALGVVHRLDRDTSGLIVFARTAAAKRALAAQFRAHDIHRLYHAIAHGRWWPARIETHLVADRGDGIRGSHGHFRAAKGARALDAKHAVTHVRPIAALAGATLVECRLETGRQHQIRIHLAELGHPLVGERVYIRDYAGSRIESARPMLHARALGFVHPRTGNGWRSSAKLRRIS